MIIMIEIKDTTDAPNIVQTRSNQTWFIIQILQYQYQYRPELDDWTMTVCTM